MAEGMGEEEWRVREELQRDCEVRVMVGSAVGGAVRILAAWRGWTTVVVVAMVMVVVVVKGVKIESKKGA